MRVSLRGETQPFPYLHPLYFLFLLPIAKLLSAYADYYFHSSVSCKQQLFNRRESFCLSLGYPLRTKA